MHIVVGHVFWCKNICIWNSLHKGCDWSRKWDAGKGLPREREREREREPHTRYRERASSFLQGRGVGEIFGLEGVNSKILYSKWCWGKVVEYGGKNVTKVRKLDNDWIIGIVAWIFSRYRSLCLVFNQYSVNRLVWESVENVDIVNKCRNKEG